jgi:Zn-dependent oligopeptidase
MVILASAAQADYPKDSPIADGLARAERSVDRIVSISDDRRTFENTVGAIDDLITGLELDANMTMFMPYVSTDAAERDAGERAEQDYSNWLIDLGKREDLYRAVRHPEGDHEALDRVREEHPRGRDAGAADPRGADGAAGLVL